MIAEKYSGPNILEQARVAIATRVAPSFLRVGQIELFARRVRASITQGDRDKAMKQLKQIVTHAISREYPGLDISDYADVVQAEASDSTASATSKAQQSGPEFQASILVLDTVDIVIVSPIRIYICLDLLYLLEIRVIGHA